MQINNRIRSLRKDYLDLTQEEFASQIKISRSNLGSIETARINVTDRVIEDICTQFNINEDWLRHGTGEMEYEPETFSLDEFVKRQGMSELELDIIKCYFELDPDIRQAVVGHFKERLFNKDSHSEVSATIEIDNTAPTIDSISEAEKEYKKNVLNSAPEQAPIVLNTTGEEKKKSV